MILALSACAGSTAARPSPTPVPDSVGSGSDGSDSVASNPAAAAEMREEPQPRLGGLKREAIAEVVRAGKEQIRHCYEKELQLGHEPELSGRIDTQFTIGGDGSVVEVKILENTMENEAVASCIENAVRGWRFPAPSGGRTVVVNYPWIFRQCPPAQCEET